VSVPLYIINKKTVFSSGEGKKKNKVSQTPLRVWLV
jgi:hypothetical protein